MNPSDRCSGAHAALCPLCAERIGHRRIDRRALRLRDLGAQVRRAQVGIDQRRLDILVAEQLLEGLELARAHHEPRGKVVPAVVEPEPVELYEQVKMLVDPVFDITPPDGIVLDERREKRQPPFSLARLEKIQRAVKAHLTQLTQSPGACTFEINTGATLEAHRWGERVSIAIGGLPVADALALRAIDSLHHIGAHRLRRCPFISRRDGECGRFFIAAHANKGFCSRKHASKAAWQKWWRETRGGTRAKK